MKWPAEEARIKYQESRFEDCKLDDLIYIAVQATDDTFNMSCHES